MAIYIYSMSLYARERAYENYLPSCVSGIKCVFGFTSCCLLCLSVAVTPGYFCCRGTTLLLSLPLRLSLTLSVWHHLSILSILKLLIHWPTSDPSPHCSVFVCVWVLVLWCEGMCMGTSQSCPSWRHASHSHLAGPGLCAFFFFSFSFVRVPDCIALHCKIKKARTGCGKTGFLILLQAALKRVCSWGTNYRLYLAYGEEIIWCAAN